MVKPDDAAVLKGVPLFADLSNRDLKLLRKQLRDETFNPGDALITEGELGGRMFVIVSGRVKVVVGGRTRRTEGPGAIIGELSVLDRGARSATVVADGRVEALSMTSTNFLSVVEEYPAIARVVMSTLARRLRSCLKDAVA